MNWIKTATLPAACLALLLAASPSPARAQAVGAAADAGATSDRAPPGNDGVLAAGGGNSGGGELPKRPTGGEHKLPRHPPEIVGKPTGPMGGKSGKVGSGSPGGHPLSGDRRKLVTAGSGSGGAPRERRRAEAGGATSAASDSTGSIASTVTGSVTTAVRVLDASGQPVAGVLLVASDGAGHVLAFASTDTSGLALLLTPESGPGALQVDALGAPGGGLTGALGGATLQAGASVLIVLAP